MKSGRSDVSVRRNNLYRDPRKKELRGSEEIKEDQCGRNLGAWGRGSRAQIMQGLGGHSGTQRELTRTMGSEVFSGGSVVSCSLQFLRLLCRE